MRYRVLVLVLVLLSACKGKEEMPDFITNDPEKIDAYAEKALKEAQEKLDSLKNTPVLNPGQ